MCNKWNQTGSCSFGDNCKYSHRSTYELIQLIEQAKQSIFIFFEFILNYFYVKVDLDDQSNFDIHRWVKKKLPNETILPESLAS